MHGSIRTWATPKGCVSWPWWPVAKKRTWQSSSSRTTWLRWSRSELWSSKMTRYPVVLCCTIIAIEFTSIHCLIYYAYYASLVFWTMNVCFTYLCMISLPCHFFAYDAYVLLMFCLCHVLHDQFAALLPEASLVAGLSTDPGRYSAASWFAGQGRHAAELPSLPHLRTGKKKQRLPDFSGLCSLKSEKRIAWELDGNGRLLISATCSHISDD